MLRRDFLKMTAVVVATRGLAACGNSSSGVAASAMTGIQQTPAVDPEAPNFFTLGVASGDPLPDAVVIWTRIDPGVAGDLIDIDSPYLDTPRQRTTQIAGSEVTYDEFRREPGSGEAAFATVFTLEDFAALPDGDTAEVFFEVRSSDDFTADDNIVAAQTVTTTTRRDYTVKIDVTNLQPATEYFYRFIFRGGASPVGRMKTAPAPGAAVEQLRYLAFSCQNFYEGYWNALANVGREENIDFTLHMGDYIYEYGGDPSGTNGVRCDPFPPASQGNPDPENSGGEHNTIQTIAEYRNKYRFYRSQPELQAAHAIAPMIPTWDDHEVRDNYYGPGFRDEDKPEGTELLSKQDRTNNAYFVYFEYMPIRRFNGDDDSTRLHRQFTFGNLMDLIVLDGRQFRTTPPGDDDNPDNDEGCAEGLTQRCEAYEDPERTNLGGAQTNWLVDQLATSRDRGAAWRMINNQTMIMPFRASPSLVPATVGDDPSGGPVFITLDSWDGYPVERAAILQQIFDRQIPDTVFITGDIHTFFAGQCWTDFTATVATAQVAATEFVPASLSSANIDDIPMDPNGGPGVQEKSQNAQLRNGIEQANPYYAYTNTDCHGYGLFELTEDQLRVTFRAVPTIRSPQPDAPAEDLAVFTQQRGSNEVVIESENPQTPPTTGVEMQMCPPPGEADET